MVDPLSKALERAQSESTSTRQWLRPGQQPKKPNQRRRTSAEDNLANTSVVPAALRTIGKDGYELDSETLEQHHVLTNSERDARMITDRYRVLRTRTLHLMNAREYDSLGVTSSSPRAGKTLTALNLAISIAREGTRPVVLLDADLRAPGLAPTLGIEPDFGVMDYLDGNCELDQLVIKPSMYPSLALLPGKVMREVPAHAPDLLQSKRMLKLMRTLKEDPERPLVIVDLPPVTVGDDVIAVTRQLDAALLVVEAGKNSTEEVTDAVEMLRTVDLIGTVLNKAEDVKIDAYGYYDHGATAAANDDNDDDAPVDITKPG